jgi:aryl-alcohol dehydrogenase-like predicted oxidoreductase
VLSRGLLSGSQPGAQRDFRAFLPRFSRDNRAANERLVETLRALAADKGATAVQLAVAWVLAKGETIVPPIGARKRPQLIESLGALDVQLSASDLARIEQTLPAAAGTRYDAHQMRILDSERT